MTRSGVHDGAAGKRLPIASLVKSLRVLERLAVGRGSSSVAELIESTGLERTTVQRVLRTLHAEGFVERSARGEYGVAPRGYVLGVMLADATHLAGAAEAVLRELQRDTGETVHAGVLDGTEVVSIACLPANRILTFNFPVGTRIPAYASSLGRVILANLPAEQALDVLRETDRRARTARTITSLKDLSGELARARVDGFCTTRDEVEVGVAAVAAPVLGPLGVPLAAVNVVVPTAKSYEADAVAILAERVSAAALELSGRLGHTAS